jgi:hypothetical protein
MTRPIMGLFVSLSLIAINLSAVFSCWCWIMDTTYSIVLQCNWRYGPCRNATVDGVIIDTEPRQIQTYAFCRVRIVFLDNINNRVDSSIIDFAVKSNWVCAKGLVPGSLTHVALGDQSWRILRVSRIQDQQTMAIELDKQTTSTSCNSSFIFHNSAMTVIHGNPAHARLSAINLRCYPISSTSSSRNESAPGGALLTIPP